jgi:hypothetical protein
MTNFKHFAGVVIFAALACTGLHAQSLNLRATIPFDFHAGDKLMPADERRRPSSVVAASRVDVQPLR